MSQALSTQPPRILQNYGEGLPNEMIDVLVLNTAVVDFRRADLEFADRLRGLGRTRAV